ncbi:unnamed protein product, partial [Closterium sp. NIES-53]
MTLRPSTAPQRVPLPSLASSLPAGPDPASDSLGAASPAVTRFLATAVTDPLFESTAVSALVTELVDFATACRLDYTTSIVAESASASVCPPSVGGECALGTDVLENRQEEFECFAASVPHLVSMLIAPEGDPDAPHIPTSRSYAEAIEDEVPPPGANIVSGMWIFRVKRPPGSPPAFKARYVARGFSQRQGVDFFQTFSPTPKMTTLRILLHIAAQRDYKLHSLDFSTAFLQGSLHEEIWLRRPPGFTGSFPAGTQWSLRRPVYGLRQAPHEWHDTLRTTLAVLGFAPSTSDPSLFLRTDTTLLPFYVLVYVGGVTSVHPPRRSRGARPTGPPSGTTSVRSPRTSVRLVVTRPVTRFLATAVTDPLFESTAVSALVTELVDFATACRLDYTTSIVAESASASVCPPSVGGECALGTDVLENRQEEFECFAASVPHLVSMLIAPEGDPDAPHIPTSRSYAEAIEGPYSSQWQAAMDAEMASWKSTGTYVDEVPPPGANIVSGMWIFRVKRPPGSPPAFKARYVARGFSQRQGVDFFQTFSPTPKMTTLRILLHIAAQRDYKLHSLDFSTAFLQGSLHEEIWLRRPPGFTGSFPAGTQWSLRRPVYGLRQAPREWHDTLRTTLAVLGFAPSTSDPSLFLRTDTTLLPFYVLVYVGDLVFATADTEALAHVKSKLQKRHTCTDLAPPSDESVEPGGPYPELVGCLMYLMTCTRPDLAYPLSFLARYVAPGRHRKVHWDAAKRVLRYLCSRSGMGLVLGGRARVVLTGHADASWVDDLATQRSSQGYTFSLGSGSISWRSTCSSSVLSSSCEAEIYAGAMAAQDLRWLTYLLTDLGEAPRSPPVLYVDNKAMLALCQEHRQEHRTKHIALRYFLARELQQRGQLHLAYVASQANTADVFTKALQPCDHQPCFVFLDWSCDLLFSPTLRMGVADLVTHLHTSDARYRAAVPARFLPTNQPPMFITLYFIVTRLPDSLRSVRDHFLTLDPTSLTVALLEQHLLAAETNAYAVGAARGTPRSPFFEGCSPSLLSSSFTSAVAANVSVPKDVGAASTSAKRRNSKGKGGRGSGEGSSGGGGGSGSGSGGSGRGGGGGEGGGGGGTGGGGGGSSGGGGGSGGSGGSGGGGTSGGQSGPHRGGPGGGRGQLADLSGGPVVASSSTVLPCQAVPSGSLSDLHIPSFSTNLGRVCTHWLLSLLRSLPLLATSAQVSASGQVAASCSCRLLSHQTLLWHHRLGHPSLPRLRGMHSRLLVSGLPRSLPPLPPSPAPPCLPCVEGQQCAAPQSSSPPTTSPLQTLHIDVWGPARVSRQGREQYFLLVVDDYTRCTTVFPLRSKGEVFAVLIPWIHTVRLQLRERFGQDQPVLRLHSERGGEFSSDFLREFCRGEGITQSFTLPDSPQQNGIAKHRIGLVVKVARTSMIHAAAPHFLWLFAVRYVAHQLNLWP